MKFIHMADMHLDAPFATLNKNGFGDSRRLEQRKVFKKVIDYIKDEQIEYLFICGDLYEHQYVRESTIRYINDLFKTIQNTKIFIIPGNHDPYLINSYYHQFKWNSNVKIFKSKIERIEEKEFDLYGYGFEDFTMPKSILEDIQILNKNKINILLMHSSIDGVGKNQEGFYNPITKKVLKESEFDYIGLGHIHKPYYKEEQNQKIIYPGSTISLGFDEPEEHGIIVGEILEDTKKIKIEFLKLDEKEFITQDVTVNDLFSKEELIEKINNIDSNKNKYYKINLIGKRNFDIDTYEIKRYIESEYILKIKDSTQRSLDIEAISKENNLRGIFVKKMLEQESEQKEKILKAIEIGLDAM